MDLLTKLEQALEGMVEGVFSRAFKAPLQPVEVAKRLTRALESQRTVSVNATYVPNVYPSISRRKCMIISRPSAVNSWANWNSTCGILLPSTTTRPWGQWQCRSQQDEELRGNDLQVATANETQAVPSVAPAPSVLRSAQPQGATARSAPHNTASLDQTAIIRPTSLEVTAGELQGRRVPLTDGLLIGRKPRLHASFLRARYFTPACQNSLAGQAPGVLMDAGSTNGTFVNERRISSHPSTRATSSR